MLNASRAYELNIIVNNRPVSEYAHEGNIFIEGRKGSEFEVEFKNKTGKKVLVIPSVDGKSVLDGERATPESKGYIVSPWGSIRIPGWTLDQTNVAKFTFEDKEKSYSALTAESDEEVITGVIGVLVYSEVETPVIHQHHWHNGWPNSYPKGGIWTTSQPNLGSPLIGGMAYDSQSVTSTGSLLRSASATLSASATTSISDNIVSNAPPIENAFEMGAGFGEKSEFKTTLQDFKRNEIVATLELFYDSRRNLEKRGIVVVKKEHQSPKLPSAFAGVGCKPPAGWQG